MQLLLSFIAIQLTWRLWGPRWWRGQPSRGGRRWGRGQLTRATARGRRVRGLVLATVGAGGCMRSEHGWHWREWRHTCTNIIILYALNSYISYDWPTQVCNLLVIILLSFSYIVEDKRDLPGIPGICMNGGMPCGGMPGMPPGGIGMGCIPGMPPPGGIGGIIGIPATQQTQHSINY
jgi:hypothetical protein